MWFNDIFNSFIFHYSILLFLFSLFHFLLCLAFQYALSFYVSLLVFSRNSVIAHPCKSIATLWACALGHNPNPKHKFGIKSHIRIQARSGIYNLAHSYVELLHYWVHFSTFQGCFQCKILDFSPISRKMVQLPLASKGSRSVGDLIQKFQCHRPH